jgi:hypothetical protein
MWLLLKGSSKGCFRHISIPQEKVWGIVSCTRKCVKPTDVSLSGIIKISLKSFKDSESRAVLEIVQSAHLM